MKTTFIFPDGRKEIVDSSELTWQPKTPQKNGTTMRPPTEYIVEHRGVLYNILEAWGIASAISTIGEDEKFLKVELINLFDGSKTDGLKHDELWQMDLKPKHRKWEYMFLPQFMETGEDAHGEVIAEQLDELGKDGFELVSVVDRGERITMFFKREILD